ncbi:hypothetical protein QN277_010626 [Acacia crassicarpa]|uniref:Uncharacterized protein n=1 Tax=Acacia crassicarpa TaxID=499986 RepID=A0AAE1IQ73_9FABA|nr:hypothetical protein QN277_010626 [Acacia crassicarpa]
MGNQKSKSSSLERRRSLSSPSAATQQTWTIPQVIQDILDKADSDQQIDKSSEEVFYDQLSSAGIFLEGKTQKFWLNKKLKCNCFMVYARALTITWESDQRYWKWEKFQESRGTMIEVAELIRVCWLDVSGKLDMKKLSAGVMYGVSFHVMLENSPTQHNWSVKVSLKLAGENYEESEINFKEMMKGTWMEIPVAQFIAPDLDGKGKGIFMEFFLRNHGEKWKRGLIVKGVSIKPL